MTICAGASDCVSEGNEHNSIQDRLDFILTHLQEPIFPRNIMTKALGHQKEVFNQMEILNYFRTSNYQDCRINAYSSFTKYDGINRTPPSFLMIDIDLKDFASKDKLDRAMNRVLKKIETIMRGHPTVFWTGNGYHIYQPMEGFILEEEEIFAKFIDQNGKDLTSKFIHFAEDFLSNKKRDPQHHPTINSCLIRIPGTINSKCGQVVKVIQRWDGQRPAINYLLRDFRRWLIAEKLTLLHTDLSQSHLNSTVGIGAVVLMMSSSCSLPDYAFNTNSSILQAADIVDVNGRELRHDMPSSESTIGINVRIFTISSSPISSSPISSSPSGYVPSGNPITGADP